jgi:hypothetical protein
MFVLYCTGYFNTLLHMLLEYFTTQANSIIYYTGYFNTLLHRRGPNRPVVNICSPYLGHKHMFSLSRSFFSACSEWIPAVFLMFTTRVVPEQKKQSTPPEWNFPGRASETHWELGLIRASPTQATLVLYKQANLILYKQATFILYYTGSMSGGTCTAFIFVRIISALEVLW